MLSQAGQKSSYSLNGIIIRQKKTRTNVYRYTTNLNILSPFGVPKKVLAHKTCETKVGRAQTGFKTLWLHDVVASWTRPCQLTISLSILHILLAYPWWSRRKKCKKRDFFRNMTSLRHVTSWRSCVMDLSMPAFHSPMHISHVSGPLMVKNGKKHDFYVNMTSLRHDVGTSSKIFS